MLEKINYLFIGKNSKIYPTAKVVNPENLFIDDFAVISDFSFILAGKYVKIGKYSNIAPYALITGGGDVIINDFVDISYGTKIISGTDDVYGRNLFTPNVPEEFRKINRLTIEIGNYCFIGANSIIYPGVKIGDGVIVNPGTIVKNNLKSWNVYEGPECKLLGKRKFKNEIIKKADELLQISKI